MKKWRLYFNRHSGDGLVWSIDDGDQANEQNVSEVRIHGTLVTQYNGQKPNEQSPVAWLEVEGRLEIIGTVAHIFGD